MILLINLLEIKVRISKTVTLTTVVLMRMSLSKNEILGLDLREVGSLVIKSRGTTVETDISMKSGKTTNIEYY